MELLPPQSVDAEKSVLGAILVKQDAIHEVMDMLQPESFYSQVHQLIYESFLSLYSKSQPIDLLTVSDELSKNENLQTIGGDQYLIDLASKLVSSANIEHYASMVMDCHLKRKIIDAGSKITEIGFSKDSGIEESIDSVEKEVSGISLSLNKSEFVDMKSLSLEAKERIEVLRKGEKKVRGIPTGFSSLDTKLSGFQPSDMIILAARPSVGKTSLALDFVRKIAVDNKKSVAFFSLEMSKDQLIDRMLSAESGIDYWKMKTGNIKTKTDFDALEDGLARLSESKIFIDDNSYNNVLRMKSAARKLKRKHGLDLLVVDYLQLMAPVSKTNSVVQEVTEISRGLKQIAKELDIPVIALSQLSRNIEHRGDNAEPRLADLRDSGSIEQDADVVMFIHRPKEEGETSRGAHTKLIIEKHRNGSTGYVDLYFDAEKTTFTEMEMNYEGFELSEE